ncbi:MAG: response regulator [Elusimicrobiota bacterium]
MKKVLVIDDEPAIAQLIKLELESCGYSVDVALSGTKGIEKIIQSQPDILCLDIMMPNMNGFQVLEVLNADNELRKIPVIMVSVAAGDVEKERAKKFGVDDFILKPIDFEKLLKTVEKNERRLYTLEIQTK